MTRITIDEAGARLRELIAALPPGQDIQITDGDRAVARLVAELIGGRTPRQPGSAAGKLVIISGDDQHLQDFRD